MKETIITDLQAHLLAVKPMVNAKAVNATFKEELGIDSLDMAEFIARVEQEYRIEIPDEDWDQIATMSLLADYVYQAKN